MSNKKIVIGLFVLISIVSVISCQVAEKAVETIADVVGGITDDTTEIADEIDKAIVALSNGQQGSGADAETIVPKITKEYTGGKDYDKTAAGQKGRASALETQNQLAQEKEKLAAKDAALGNKYNDIPKKDDGTINDSDSALDKAVADGKITNADKAKIKEAKTEATVEAKKKTNSSIMASMTQQYSKSIEGLLFSYLFTKIIEDNKGVPVETSHTTTLDSAFFAGFKTFYINTTGQTSFPKDPDGNEIVPLFGQGGFSTNCPSSCFSITLTDLMQSTTSEDLKDNDGNTLYNMKVSAAISLAATGTTASHFTTVGGENYVAAIYVATKEETTGTTSTTKITKFKFVFTSPMSKLYDYTEVYIHDITNGHFTQTKQTIVPLLASNSGETAYDTAYDKGLFDKSAPVTLPEGVGYPILEVTETAFKKETTADTYTFISSISGYGMLSLSKNVNKVGGVYDSTQHPLIFSNTVTGKITKSGKGTFSNEYKVRQATQVPPATTYTISVMTETRNVEMTKDGIPTEFNDVDATTGDKKEVVDIRKNAKSEKDAVKKPTGSAMEKDYDHNKMDTEGKMPDTTDRKHKETPPAKDEATDLTQKANKPTLTVTAGKDTIYLVVGHKFDLAKNSDGKVPTANFVLKKGTTAVTIDKVAKTKVANKAGKKAYALAITFASPAATGDTYTLAIARHAIIVMGGHKNSAPITAIGTAQ